MKSPKLIFPFILFLIVQISVKAQVTITLDTAPASSTCNDIWTENSLDIKFVQTTAEDCNVGSCFFGIEPTFLWLFPSRMTVDLSSLTKIQKVEIDIIDFCGVNCTRAFIYDVTSMVVANTGNTVISSSETLSLLNPTEGDLSELAISSCEGQVHEIRIFQNDVSSTFDLSEISPVIYPNPGRSVDDLKLSFPLAISTTKLKHLEIFDAQGRQVLCYEAGALTDMTNIIIPSQHLSSGIYLLKGQLDNQFFSQKIVRF